jgi:hypothetical protein
MRRQSVESTGDLKKRDLHFTPPAHRERPLFDNSLNIEGLRVKNQMENGYEEGCTQGANNECNPVLSARSFMPS